MAILCSENKCGMEPDIHILWLPEYYILNISITGERVIFESKKGS